MVLKEKTPLLSIIVPVYNVEKFLEECVYSILQQEFKNFELLLVDDGSTDSSSRLCDEFAIKDARIRVFHKTNGGQSSARNLALKEAKGKYLSFVDSDDYISNDFFAPNIKVLEELNLDLIKIPYATFGLKNVDYPNQSKMIKDQDDLFCFLITTDSYLWNRIYKRSIFDELKFPEGMIMEDVYLTPKIIKNIKSIFISNQGLYYYRLRENSTVTKTHTPKILEDILRAYLSYLDITYYSNHRDIFIKYYATYLTGYFETKANFKNHDFSYFKKEYTKFKIDLSDVLKYKLPWKQRIKLILVIIFGIDFVANCFAPFHQMNPNKII
jgi:glycosyltransferase involved in cell wall biosynthesis